MGELVRAENPLDLLLGMEYYSRPEVYLGSGFSLRLSPENFRVYEEVYGLGRAQPGPRVHRRIECIKGEKLLVVICKRGISTLDLYWELIECGIRLRYWGIKDAEAETCQFAIVECLADVKFANCYPGRFEVFLVSQADQDLAPRKYELAGNHFDVEISHSGTELSRATHLAELSSSLTYLNYYGYQRFGTVRPVTHLVGRALAVGDYEEALTILVGYQSDAELPRVREARRLFSEGKYVDALKLFPAGFRLERSVLRAYMRYGNPEKALKIGLPKAVFRFFLESYQSYLFNKALSRLAEASGGIDGVEERCEVMELPRPGIQPSGCGLYPHEVLVEDLGEGIHKLLPYFLAKVLRETTFRVHDLRVDHTISVLRLRFKLGRGVYATTYLRELLRDNLKLR